MIGIGILTGGKSSRMGTAKSQLDFFGCSFLERKIKMWEKYPIYLSVNHKETLFSLPVKDITIVEDSFSETGPVGGIYEVLKATSYRWNFICAVDLPFIKKEIPDFLELFIEEDYDCVLFTLNGKIHPLCGLYRKELAEFFKISLEQKKLKLISLLKMLRVKYIPLEKTAFPLNLLDNVNRPNEYIRSFGNSISICGLKNTGKTTFINGVLRSLSEMGVETAVLKHDGRHDFSIDQKGTDTYSYAESGAKNVIVFNEKKIAQIRYEKNRIDYKEILERERGKQDIMIIEGLKGEPLPKFEILRKSVSEVPQSNPVNRLGIISDIPYTGEGLHFDLNQPSVFAQYLYELFVKDKNTI